MKNPFTWKEPHIVLYTATSDATPKCMRVANESHHEIRTERASAKHTHKTRNYSKIMERQELANVTEKTKCDHTRTHKHIRGSYKVPRNFSDKRRRKTNVKQKNQTEQTEILECNHTVRIWFEFKLLLRITIGIGSLRFALLRCAYPNRRTESKSVESKRWQKCMHKFSHRIFSFRPKCECAPCQHNRRPQSLQCKRKWHKPLPTISI